MFLPDFPPSTLPVKNNVVLLLASLYPPHFFDLSFTTRWVPLFLLTNSIMSCFQYGPRDSMNSILDLVVNMLHYDKAQEFPWSDSISTLTQGGIMLLGSLSTNSMSLKVGLLWLCDAQRLDSLFKDLLFVGDRRDDGVTKGELVILVPPCGLSHA